MTTFWTVDDAYGYGISVHQARRLTEEEKIHFVESAKETTFMGIPGTTTDLKGLTWEDMPRRTPDGSFRGCGNRAWIIAEDEKDRLIALSESRVRQKELDDLRGELETLNRYKAEAERQKDIPSREEAKRREREYNSIYNEGGEGYVPHIIHRDEYAGILSRIAEITAKLEAI